MKLFPIIVLLILAAQSFATGQTTAPGAGQKLSSVPLAEEELIDAAREYKAGRFREAEFHVRCALEIDPDNKHALFFLARSIHSQYKQDVSTPENVKVAENAIEAYKRILATDANNDESYKAVAFLLGQLGRRDEQREWVAQRAADESVGPAKRSIAYVFLANHAWECSFIVTESRENQRTVRRGARVVTIFKKPRNPESFEKARQCARLGMTLVEKAIALDPENEKAWGYKTNLLLEMAKLSEMDGDPYERDDYVRQARVAQARTTQITAEKFRRAQNNTGSAEDDTLPPPPIPLPNF